MRFIALSIIFLFTLQLHSQDNCDQIVGDWIYIAYSDLEGSKKDWRTPEYNEYDMILGFSDSLNTFGGRSETNSFGGNYSCKENGITITDMLSTQVAEHGVSDIFWSGIREADSFKMKSDTLLLICQKRNTILHFLPKK